MKKHTILALIAVILLVAWHRQQIVEFLGMVSDRDAVSAYLQSYGPLGPIVLFILMVAQVFIAVIPGHALMVTAGYVYGKLGLGVVIASTVLGSQLAFLVSRRYGRGLIYKIASPEVIKKWDGTARHQGILFYFFAFVLPIFPNDLMCYVAGLSTISAHRFFVSNILGRSVVAISITLIGMYGMKPPVWFWVAAVVVLAALFVSWMLYKRVGKTVPESHPQACGLRNPG